MKNYRNRIGDGQLPNIYYVFQFDEKATRNGDELEYPETEARGGYIGQFRSYEKALACVDNKAYLPHVIIEDRLSGVVFEQYVEVCGCCGEEKYHTLDDIGYTKKQLGANFK